ncbi:MAG: hydrogenase maturation nickel metallochaperone HypA [Cytophagales bacterium]|nr:MAG: hydrogenase maturation nickel metallochaperone HypA [Cytophagales bacterium]
MHEISLVRSIFRTLEDKFSKEELSQITQIDLKVGLLANVEPILMQSAFEAVTQTEPQYANTTLHIDLLPIVVHCPACQKEHTVQNYRFVCSCGTPTNQIIQGNELLISQVHFKENFTYQS